MSDDLSYAEQLEVERIGTASESYDEYQESQNDSDDSSDSDSGGDGGDSSSSGDSTPEPTQEQEQLLDGSAGGTSGSSSSGSDDSLDTSDPTLPDEPSVGDNPFDGSDGSSDSSSSSGGGGDDSSGSSGDSTPEPTENQDQLLDGSAGGSSGDSPDTGQGIGPDGVSGSEAATPDSETDSPNNDSTEDIDATKTGELESTGGTSQEFVATIDGEEFRGTEREIAQRIEREAVGSQVGDLSDRLRLTGAELREEDVQVTETDSGYRTELSPVGRERVQTIAERQADEQAERAVEEELNTAFTNADVNVDNSGNVGVSDSVENEATRQDIAESNPGVSESDISIQNGEIRRDTNQTDVSPNTPGAGEGTARSQVVKQLEDKTGTDLSRDDVTFTQTDDGVRGKLSDQGEITVARENAPFSDIPGVGDLFAAGAEANERIKDTTDPAAEGYDDVTPDQQDAYDAVESVFGQAGTTDVPFTDTDFDDASEFVTETDAAQTAAETDVPFTDTDIGNAGQFAETAGNTDVPFTDTDMNDADDLVAQAVNSATEVARNAPETAAETDVPFTDTDFADAGELPNRAEQSATDAAVEASVPVRQEVYGVTEDQARENIRQDISQAGEGTYDAFSPAVGRNPAGSINAVRGIAGIAGITGGAAAVNELDVGESSQDQNELQPGDPTASESELEATEQTTSELDVGQGLTSSEIDVQVGQQQTDPSQLQLAQQIVIGEEIEEQREITEEDIVQDRPGRIGRGINRGPRINEEREGGVSELYDPQRPVIEDDGSDIFERTFPTGGSAVVGEGTSDPVEEVRDQLEQGQQSEVGQGTDTIVGSGQVQDPIVGQQPDQTIDEQVEQIQDGIQDQIQDQTPNQTPNGVQEQFQFPEPTESIFETGGGAGFGSPTETVPLEEELQVQEPTAPNQTWPSGTRRLPRLNSNTDEEELEDIEEQIDTGSFDTAFADAEDLLGR